MARIERAGRAVDFDVRGEGPRTVLLAHNLLTDRSVFEPHAVSLSERFRTINVDLRGHGKSEAPAGPFTTGDLAGDLLAILDAVGARRASLVGVSLGSSAIMETAVRAPDRVERMVVMAGTGTAESLLGRIPNLTLVTLMRIFGARAFLVRQALPILFGETYRRANPAAIAAREAKIRAMGARTIGLGVRAWLRRERLLERLAAVKAPTLVVTGDEDVACPHPHGAAIAAAIPGARIATIAHAGHTIPGEQPEMSLKFVEDFLDEDDS